MPRVRVYEANKAGDDKPAGKVITQSRWLLLKNAANIEKEEDCVRLAELRQVNGELSAVYVLKDDLKQLWDYRHTGYATQFWQQWYASAVRSRIEQLKAASRCTPAFWRGSTTRSR